MLSTWRIQNGFYTDQKGEALRSDQTVEYDRLLKGYVAGRTKVEEHLIDIAYCQYILGIYNEKPLEAAGVSSDEKRQQAEKKVKALVQKLDALYGTLVKTNEEYNQYAGAQNINLLTGIAVSSKFNIWLYVALIVAAFAVLGCMAAVAFGRMRDIWGWYGSGERVDFAGNRTPEGKTFMEGRRLSEGQPSEGSRLPEGLDSVGNRSPEGKPPVGSRPPEGQLPAGNCSPEGQPPAGNCSPESPNPPEV